MKRTFGASAGRLVMGVAALLSVAATTYAAPLVGRAIVVSQRGDAHYESSDGIEALEEGMALTHGHRIVAEKGAALCVLLTPGALVCVHENTGLDLETLEHTSDGLPGEAQAELRRIGLVLGRGAILVHAGDPEPGRSITVRLDRQTLVTSRGGTFTLTNEKGKRYIDVEKGAVDVEAAGSVETLEAGARMLMERRSDGGWDRSTDRKGRSRLPYDFYVCRRNFGALAPLAFDWQWDHLGGLGEWIDGATEVQYVGVPRESQDVSPSLRRTVYSQHPSGVPPAARPGGAGQWRRPDVWDWYRRVGTLRGVNYLPRTAVNPIEMWQAETFDRDTIDEELGWANDVDLDSVRVFVPYAVWARDADGLKDRMDAFLKLANGHDLSTVFVLFDDRQARGTPVQVGVQPDPVAGVHNSRWTASPGHALVPESAGEWEGLKAYVQDIIGAFRGDRRVLLWDLYNEAGHSGMGIQSMPLVEAAFKWAREMRPDQPITAGIGRTLPGEARQSIMKLSDVVTLAEYEDAEQVRAMLALAATRGRPVICSGWLRRGQGNTFKDVLPVFSQFGVGWYHWGLVQGRSQLYMPWDAAPGAAAPEVWEQDLLNDKGEPLDEDEIEMIKGFAFDTL